MEAVPRHRLLVLIVEFTLITDDNANIKVKINALIRSSIP